MSAYIMSDNEINTIVSYFLNPNNGVDVCDKDHQHTDAQLPESVSDDGSIAV